MTIAALMDVRTTFTPLLIATLIKMTITMMMTNLLIDFNTISIKKIMDDSFHKIDSIDKVYQMLTD